MIQLSQKFIKYLKGLLQEMPASGSDPSGSPTAKAHPLGWDPGAAGAAAALERDGHLLQRGLVRLEAKRKNRWRAKKKNGGQWDGTKTGTQSLNYKILLWANFWDEWILGEMDPQCDLDGQKCGTSAAFLATRTWYKFITPCATI